MPGGGKWFLLASSPFCMSVPTWPMAQLQEPGERSPVAIRLLETYLVKWLLPISVDSLPGHLWTPTHHLVERHDCCVQSPAGPNVKPP